MHLGSVVGAGAAGATVLTGGALAQVEEQKQPLPKDVQYLKLAVFGKDGKSGLNQTLKNPNLRLPADERKLLKGIVSNVDTFLKTYQPGKRMDHDNRKKELRALLNIRQYVGNLTKNNKVRNGGRLDGFGRLAFSIGERATTAELHYLDLLTADKK